MATVNLGRIKPVFRGAYSGSTAYVVDDIVTSGNETYICIQAHGAGTQAVTQTAYWTKLAAKGTDGTDVGTTITTQGDILYRDGSGLARLAAGTSGQFLKTQGSGANPIWDDPTGGQLVLIKKITPSGSVNTIEFVNGSNGVVLDGSVYGRYFFSFSGIGCQTDVNNMALQIGTSGSYITGSNQYRWHGNDNYQDGTVSNRGSQATFWTMGGVGSSNASGETNWSGECWLNLNSEGGNDFPNYFSRATYWQDNNNSVFSQYGGNLADTGTIAKVKFFWHSNYNGGTVGTLRSFENFGSITMYGLKTT